MCPILDLCRGADPLIPTEDIAEWDAAFKAGGLSREIITYDNAA